MQQAYLGDMNEHVTERADGGKKVAYLRVSPALHRGLRILAAVEGVSLQDIAERAVQELLDRQPDSVEWRSDN